MGAAAKKAFRHKMVTECPSLASVEDNDLPMGPVPPAKRMWKLSTRATVVTASAMINWRRFVV